MAPAADPISAMWSAYREHAALADDRFEIVSFGDSPAMATELAGLIVGGRKRATASLRHWYEGGTLTAAGDFGVVVDGDRQPRCIIRTTEIRIGPLSSVDDRFAWDEGEGDRSRTYWMAEHTAFFTRAAAVEGFTMHHEIETVFERFEVVWPLDLAG
jgi:uncharacterized protein YhfF